MSLSMTKPPANDGATKKGDGWLHRMGIGINRIRHDAAQLIPGRSSSAEAPALQPVPVQPAATQQPAQPAPVQAAAVQAAAVPAPKPAGPSPEQVAYDAAIDRIAMTARLIDVSSPTSETGKLKAAFDAIAVPGAGPIQDYAQALAALKPKLDLVDMATDASGYDLIANTAIPVIRRAGVYTMQSGPIKGLEGAYDEAMAFKAQSDTALKQQQFQTASNLIVQARKKAEPIGLYNDTLVSAERNGPMFARAEGLLAGKSMPSALKDQKRAYESASSSFEAAHAAADPSAMRSFLAAKNKAAIAILEAGQKPTVDAWFDHYMGRPASGQKGTGGGIADTMSTMHGMAEMGELEKFALTAKRAGRTLERHTELIKQVYAKALKEGVKLNLTPAQIAAVAGYSGFSFTEVNGLLRGSLDMTNMTPARLDAIKLQAALMQQALERLPQYPTAAFPVYRWEIPHGNYLQTRYQVASPVFEIKEFWSTGAGGGSAVAGPPTAEIIIWGKKSSGAKDINLLSSFGASEGGRTDGGQLKNQSVGEVLFSPGSKFKTVKFEALDTAGHKLLKRLDSNKAELAIRYRIEVQEV